MSNVSRSVTTRLLAVNSTMTSDYARAATRITRTLFAAQSLSSAATVAIFPIVAIAGAKLSGQSTWAGVPAMAYQLGAAFAAFLWGRLMDPLGRRSVLAIGMFLGAIGSTISGAAILTQAFWAFFAGSVLLGMAVSAVQLSRFVSAEVHPIAERARAISTVVLGGTVGAILGPLMAGPLARLAASRGLDELAGPYAASIVLFTVGAGLIAALLHPEPRDLGRALAQGGDTPSAGPARTLNQIYREWPALVATAAMLFGQLVMTMLMVITPLHMRGHHHAIGSISFVISAHVVGMYAFSVLSGRLADGWGRLPVIMTGGGLLILASLASTFSPEVLPLSGALFLLGLGWNLSYVGGSSLLADQLSPLERARTQGFNDLLVGLASGAGSLGSGIVFAGVGYNAMGLVGIAVALVPLTLSAARWSRRHAAAPA